MESRGGSAIPKGRGTEAKQVESFGHRVDLRPSATDPAGSGMRRNRGRWVQYSNVKLLTDFLYFHPLP